MNGPRILVLETSDRIGQVAVAAGRQLLAAPRLDENRRHARDLAPAVKELLTCHGWHARDLDAVLVSRGPGSYTGLRVGVMSAKTLAYATGCALVAVDTFAALAEQVGEAWENLDVLADAQQDKVYVQSFRRSQDSWEAVTVLTIRPFAVWLAERRPEAALTGPGLRKWAGHVPAGIPMTEPSCWDVEPASVLNLGLDRLEAGKRDDPFGLEPIYLRPSSAEEQVRARS